MVKYGFLQNAYLITIIQFRDKMDNEEAQKIAIDALFEFANATRKLIRDGRYDKASSLLNCVITLSFGFMVPNQREYLVEKVIDTFEQMGEVKFEDYEDFVEFLKYNREDDDNELKGIQA